MAQLTGALVVIELDRIDRFDWTNDKGVITPIQKFVGKIEPGDGTRIWIEIGFPRDPNYKAPNLTPGKHYAMPVLIGVDKKKGVPRLTIRTDVQPFEAPNIA